MITILTLMLILQIVSLALNLASYRRSNEGSVKECRVKEIINSTVQSFKDMKISPNEDYNDTALVLEHLQNRIKENDYQISIIKEIISRTWCGIQNANWRRVAYINMTNPEAECPSGLNEVSNSDTGQRACGRSVNRGCSSIFFPVSTLYSHVCGYARGYQYGHMDALKSSSMTIDDTYVDGISVTRGRPRKHLWTLAVGEWEDPDNSDGCPRDQSPFDFSRIPNFVTNQHFHCETGMVKYTGGVAWSDPLWDGAGCVADTAHSCDRHGWFHREIEPTQDDIEVRWCADEQLSVEDVYIDLLEIWVL